MPTSDVDTAMSTDEQIDPAVGHMIRMLARRQQSLINDVLVVLDELEQDETSPIQLDRLFRVDHLTTLVGRSASSLGVLLDTTTRTADDPLPFADVLQAAIAGVDDFRRVVLPPAPAGEVVSEAAPDVVHLLTEIIDYSLAHNNSETAVSIHPPRAEGPTVIRVANPSLRLPPGPLAALNIMLRADKPALADCPDSMGLYLISRLAHRHGLEVRLAPNENGGTTASIRVPSTLFLGGFPDPSPIKYIGRHRKESRFDTAVSTIAQYRRRVEDLHTLTRTWVARTRAGRPPNYAD